MLSFKPTFSLSSFAFIKRLFSSSSLSAIKGDVICISEVTDISPSNLDSSLCFFFFSSLCFIQPGVGDRNHEPVCLLTIGLRTEDAFLKILSHGSHVLLSSPSIHLHKAKHTGGHGARALGHIFTWCHAYSY